MTARPEGIAWTPLIWELTCAGSSARSFWSVAYGLAVRALCSCGSRTKSRAICVGRCFSLPGCLGRWARTPVGAAGVAVTLAATPALLVGVVLIGVFSFLL